MSGNPDEYADGESPPLIFLRSMSVGARSRVQESDAEVATIELRRARYRSSPSRSRL
jgi:hypothetical protein